jgi:hypothetical protein
MEAEFPKGDQPPMDEYDSPWKEALREYFQEFMTFFFPEIAREIDWSREVEFLDKELHRVVRQAVSQERSVDKLVKVWRTVAQDPDSQEQHKKREQVWVLIHVDVQSQYKSNFKQRMYIYNYRLFDNYLQPIATLVILGDEEGWWRPKEYSHELWGCEIKMTFPSVKLLDYQTPQKWEQLKQSDNPFALIVMAHLYTKDTKHKPQERFEFKWRLTRSMYERGYSKQKILSLFRFIDSRSGWPYQKS